MKATEYVKHEALMLVWSGLAVWLVLGAFLSGCATAPPAPAVKPPFTLPKLPVARAKSLTVLGNVTVAWDPSPSAGVTGYKVYSGPSSRSYSSVTDVGQVTAATVPLYFQTNFLSVTAYSTNLESIFSNEISYSLPVTPTVYTLYAEWSTNILGPWAAVPGFVPVVVTNNSSNAFFRIRIQ